MKRIFLAFILSFTLIIGSIGIANAYSVFNTTFTDPAGLTFGTLTSGLENNGYNYAGSYSFIGGPTPGGGVGVGDARDWYYAWNGIGSDNDGFFRPAADGLIWDLGGQANKVVVFPLIDHGPVGPESWEYDVFLSNDLSTWTQANLEAYYTEGWTTSLASATPYEAAGTTAIGDGYTTVWSLLSGETARYVSITPGNSGNPDSSFYFDSFDVEIDAVAGLTESGGSVSVPEPSTFFLLGSGLAGLGLIRRKFQITS